MKRFKRILVGVDTRFETHPALQQAAVLADRNGASLKIVDGLPELSWPLRAVLSDEYDNVQELEVADKTRRLEALAELLRGQGIDVATKVLVGRSSVEIIREVLRDNHDLVIRVAKGSTSRRTGFFGNTGLRLLRKCPAAVMLVTPAAHSKYDHVLACVDPISKSSEDAELNNLVLELTTSIAEYEGSQTSIVHAWELYGESILRSHMKSEELQSVHDRTRGKIESAFDKFLAQHGTSIRSDNAHLLEGDPPVAIARFAAENGVDLVVMGTVARAGISGLLTGNTAETILSRIECSVLAIKPSGFVSPITLE